MQSTNLTAYSDFTVRYSLVASVFNSLTYNWDLLSSSIKDLQSEWNINQLAESDELIRVEYC